MLKLTHNKAPAGLVILVCCLLFLAILNTWFSGFGWHDQQRVVQLFILVALSIFIFKIPIISNLSGTTLLLLLTVFLLGAISAALTSNIAWAFKEWAHYAGLCILAIGIARITIIPNLERLILLSLVIIAFINTFQFATYYFMAFATGIKIFDADLLFNGFSNPRFLNQFQMLFMPILAYITMQYWQTTHRYSKLIASIFFITLLVQWCIAFSLGGRGLWLSLAVSHAFLIIFFPRHWHLLAIQVASGLLGVILFFLMFTAIPEWLGQTSSVRDSMRFGLSKREVIWQMAWDMFLANPWLGAGPMHFSAEVNSVAAHPHQAILQWLAEWGVFATLAAVFIAIRGMLHGLRFVRSEESQPLDAALWISILGALTLAQVDGVFVMPYTETWLAILIGLAMARWSVIDQKNYCQTYSIRLLAITVVLILSNSLINEVPTLNSDSQKYMEKHGTGFTPRFWMQGWIPMDRQQ